MAIILLVLNSKFLLYFFFWQVFREKTYMEKNNLFFSKNQKKIMKIKSKMSYFSNIFKN